MKKSLLKIRVAYRRIFRPSRICVEGKKLIVNRRKFTPFIVNRLIQERYERSEIRLVRKGLSSDDRVLELGAGMGLATMIVADLVGDNNLLCYEADPYMVEIARTNFERNNHNIEIRHGIVCSGKVLPQTTKEFHIQKDFWSSSSQRNGGAVETISVPVTSLRSLLESFCPTVLLMDIEGDEVDLLTGEERLEPLKKIIMEVHYRYAGKHANNRMIRHLNSMGFDIDLKLSGSEQVFLTKG